MTHETDLLWLEAECPDPLPLDGDATRRARLELLRHMRQTRRWRTMPRMAAVAVAAGAVACVAVLATGGSTPTARLHVPVAKAAPLVLLSNHLHAKASDQPTLPGDATLIERHQAYPDDKAIDGFDLYSDSGRYYYSVTRAGLPAAIRAWDADTNPLDDDEFTGRDVKAAAAAFAGPIEQARERMGNANFPDGKPPKPAKNQATVQAQLRAAKLKGVDPQPIDAKTRLENYIWMNSMDALNAGAGREDVRAGVLHLLATIDGVTVTAATDGGRDVLVLKCAEFSGDYRETLTVDAHTGMPIRFTGGDEGKPPSVTVTYTVTRVRMADLRAQQP